MQGLRCARLVIVRFVVVSGVLLSFTSALVSVPPVVHAPACVPPHFRGRVHGILTWAEKRP